MLSCLKLPEKNYIVNAQGAHILLGYDDYQSFETPIINNHSVTAPSYHIFLGGENAQSLDTPKNNHSVTAPSDHKLMFRASFFLMGGYNA